MHSFVALMRRYVVDYTNRHDVSVCADIMEPDYVLHMGGHDLGGRDEAYLPAVHGQFDQFPNLTLTVHELVCSGHRLAMRFSEHGASNRHGGRAAAWGGVALYRWNGRRLTENFVEQDYFARRRQLATGGCDPVEAPAPAPWDGAAEPANPAAEQAVREWLAAPRAVDEHRIQYDDEWTGRLAFPLLAARETEVHEVFSAGETVAFRALCRGEYLGGLGVDRDDARGRPASMHLAGLLRMSPDGRLTGRVIRDRLGLYRALGRTSAEQVESSA